MKLTDEGLKKLIRGIGKLIQEGIKDPIFAEHVRVVVEESMVEKTEKRERPDEELTPTQKIVRRVYKTYDLAGTPEADRPPPGLILRWRKQWESDEKFGQAMRALREGGMMEMPVAYQIKVMNGWLKSGKPRTLQPQKRGSTHTTAGLGDGDREAMRKRLEGE